MHKLRRVLVIEDHDDLRASATRTLEAAGLEVVALPSVKPVDARVDVIVLDLNLRDTEGGDSIRATKDLFGLTPIVVWTGITDYRQHTRAVEMGADCVVEKGHRMRFLLDAIHQAHARRIRGIDFAGMLCELREWSDMEEAGLLASGG